MDTATLIATAVAIAGTAGGYVSGRSTVTIQAEAINALRTKVDLQQGIIDTIPGLQSEIAVLQGLVTQRANVEKVIEIVERTEAKVDELVHGSGGDRGERD